MGGTCGGVLWPASTGVGRVGCPGRAWAGPAVGCSGLNSPAWLRAAAAGPRRHRRAWAWDQPWDAAADEPALTGLGGRRRDRLRAAAAVPQARRPRRA